MLNILSAKQSYQADQATMEAQNISSWALMERAAQAFLRRFLQRFPSGSVCVICGNGNNGGDGLAIARLLQEQGFQVSVVLAPCRGEGSADFLINLEKVRQLALPQIRWQDLEQIEAPVIIDAIFGIGLNRPLDGELRGLVEAINDLGKMVVSVDVPSGMPSQGALKGTELAIKAGWVITFNAPKLSFLVPESQNFIQEMDWVDIELDDACLQAFPPEYRLVQQEDILEILQLRKPFSHKGNFGRVLLWAGDRTTLGAALLCSKAALNAGAGLLFVCVPDDSRHVLNLHCPEAMFLSQEAALAAPGEYTAIGMGPGLGSRSVELPAWLERTERPVLLDADALNALARSPELLAQLPAESVITPHMGEFDRLFGYSSSWLERLELARKKAQEHRLIIVLKNRYTFIVSPDRQVRINPTGNPAMSSGGTGDVLSGVITALLGQGYMPLQAASLGVYAHGLAADRLRSRGMGVIPASMLTEQLPYVFGELSRLKREKESKW